MVPTLQGAVLTAAAAENAAAADAARGTVKSTAADNTDDVLGGAVKPTAAADAVRGTMKPTAADDAALGAVKATAVDDTGGLCRRACRDHFHHGLRDSLGPRHRAPGRRLAAWHL